MKRLIILIVAMVIIAGITHKVRAQTDQVSTAAGASLVVPLTIQKNPLNMAMHFGVITITNPSISGKCVLSTRNRRTYQGGVTGLPYLNQIEPVTSNALYLVFGTLGEYYQLTIPESIDIFGIGAALGASMIVNDLTVRFNSNTANTLAPFVSILKYDEETNNGYDDIFIGGTVNVAPGQHDGVYTGTFNASVEYN